jgi:hypothetical protein
MLALAKLRCSLKARSHPDSTSVLPTSGHCQKTA